MTDSNMVENLSNSHEIQPYWERDFIHNSVRKVAAAIARYSIDPETVSTGENTSDLKLSDMEVAKRLSKIDVYDHNLTRLDFSIDQGVVNAAALVHAKALAQAEATFDAKYRTRTLKFGEEILDKVGNIIASVSGKKGVTAASTLALLATACGTNIVPSAPEVSPQTVIASETETVPIEITPALPPTNVAPAEIALNVSSPLPPYITGSTENSSIPQDSIAFTEGENPGIMQTLRSKGLMPVVSEGVFSYKGPDSKSYMPVIDQITDSATGEVLKPTQAADKDGVVTYKSEDGSITQYSIVSVACGEGFGCLQVVSFNPEDPGVTYNLKVDLTTGKIVGYMPAISATKPSGASFESIDSSKWATPLTGEAALGQVEGLMGISYIPGGETQDGKFSFVSGDEVITSTDKEIVWQSDFGLVVKKDDGDTYIWDGAKSQWVKAEEATIEEVKDGAQIFKAGDRNFIQIEGRDVFVASISPDTKGTTTAITPEGTAYLWHESAWQPLEPEGPLTLESVKEGSWGSFTFNPTPEGYYELKDSQGNLIPDFKVFEDGTSELTYEGNVLTNPFQAVTQKDGGIIVGLWEYKAGEWNIEAYSAPKSEAETLEWRSLVIVQGHEKEQAMIDTIFLARNQAMAKSETFDPANALPRKVSITVNFRTIDNFDIRPKLWNLRTMKNTFNEAFDIVPVSRSNEVVYVKGRLGYARPLQVINDAPAWFGIKIQNENGNIVEEAIHVPVLAMDTDGTLVNLSAAVSKSTIEKLLQMITPEKHVDIVFYVFGATNEPKWGMISDLQLTTFMGTVNSPYYVKDRTQKGIGGKGQWTVYTLPPELGKMLLGLLDSTTHLN